MDPQERKKTRCFLFTPSELFTDEEIKMAADVFLWSSLIEQFDNPSPRAAAIIKEEGKSKEELTQALTDLLKKIPPDSFLGGMTEIQKIREEFLGP